MGCDQNLRELSVNVISDFTICGNREICEWQVCLFFVISSEKLVDFSVISHEIAEIMQIGHKLDFTT